MLPNLPGGLLELRRQGRSSKWVAASRESAAHFSSPEKSDRSIRPENEAGNEEGRGWAGTAHTTEDNPLNEEGPKIRQQYRDRNIRSAGQARAHISVPIFLS